MMIRVQFRALLLALAIPGSAWAAPGDPPPRARDVGRETGDLSRHLQKEGVTVFLFITGASVMEQKFLADQEAALPKDARLGLRVIRLRGLEDDAARRHEITATPTALVLDRFGRTLGRSSQPDEIGKLVGRGLRMGRIAWVDEEDPRGPEVYGRPAEMLQRGIPGIVKAMSPRQDVLRWFMELSRIHFSDGFLDRRNHELIATYVSTLNKCRF